MAITLNWTNEISGEDGTRIYRSPEPIDELNLPAPIATVGPNVTEYEDTDVAKNAVYFYRFGVFKGGDEYLSKNESVYTSTYRGPGPQELIAGNYHDLGLFGRVSTADFFTAPEIMQQLPGSPSWSTFYSTEDWVKVFHGGKIKYFSLKNIAYSHMSWKNIYEAGAVFGEPGDCQDKISPEIWPNLTPTDQRTVIQKEGHLFVPRLWRGWSDANPFDEETQGYYTGTYPAIDSEFVQVLQRLASTVDHPDREGDLLSYRNSGWLFRYAQSWSFANRMCFQEQGGTSVPLLDTRYQYLSPGNVNTSGRYQGWWPVIDLIPQN